MNHIQLSEIEIQELLPKLIEFINKRLGKTQKKISEKTEICESAISDLKKSSKREYKYNDRNYFYQILNAFELEIVKDREGFEFKANEKKVDETVEFSRTNPKKDDRLIFCQEIPYTPFITKLVGSYIGFVEYQKGVFRQFAVNINENFSIEFQGQGYKEGFLMIQDPNLFFVLFGDKEGNKYTKSELLIAKIGRRLRSQEEIITRIPVSINWVDNDGNVYMGIGVLLRLQDWVKNIREIDYDRFPMPEDVKHFFEKTGLNKVIVINYSTILFDI